MAPIAYLAHTLNIVIDVLILTILVTVAFSWARMFGMRIPPYHPVVRVIEQSADLVLGPIRRNMPTAGGGIDFSPMIGLIVLYIIREIVNRLV